MTNKNSKKPQTWRLIQVIPPEWEITTRRKLFK